MKQTLFKNLKYLAMGVVLATAIGFVHASTAGPTATAPANNIDAPLHTGPSQVKDGGLSVDTFLASQNAAFKQQTFLAGTIFGGAPGTPSTLFFGDTAAPANIAASGDLSAKSFIKSTSVANSSSSALCADTNGTIVLCAGAASTGGDAIFVYPVRNGNYVYADLSQSFESAMSVEISLETPAYIAGHQATVSFIDSIKNSIASRYTAFAEAVKPDYLNPPSINDPDQSDANDAPPADTSTPDWYNPGSTDAPASHPSTDGGGGTYDSNPAVVPPSGTCKKLNTGKLVLGTVTIDRFAYQSSSGVLIPSDCGDSSNYVIVISAYGPTTTGNGTPIKANQGV